VNTWDRPNGSRVSERMCDWPVTQRSGSSRWPRGEVQDRERPSHTGNGPHRPPVTVGSAQERAPGLDSCCRERKDDQQHEQTWQMDTQQAAYVADGIAKVCCSAEREISSFTAPKCPI